MRAARSTRPSSMPSGAISAETRRAVARPPAGAPYRRSARPQRLSRWRFVVERHADSGEHGQRRGSQGAGERRNRQRLRSERRWHDGGNAGVGSHRCARRIRAVGPRLHRAVAADDERRQVQLRSERRIDEHGRRRDDGGDPCIGCGHGGRQPPNHPVDLNGPGHGRARACAIDVTGVTHRPVTVAPAVTVGSTAPMTLPPPSWASGSSPWPRRQRRRRRRRAG